MLAPGVTNTVKVSLEAFGSTLTVAVRGTVNIHLDFAQRQKFVCARVDDLDDTPSAETRHAFCVARHQRDLGGAEHSVEEDVETGVLRPAAVHPVVQSDVQQSSIIWTSLRACGWPTRSWQAKRILAVGQRGVRAIWYTSRHPPGKVLHAKRQMWHVLRVASGKWRVERRTQHS